MIRRLGLSFCLWLLAFAAAAAGPAPLPGDSTYQLQARLLDQAGQPVQWRQLRGKPRLVTMFYSHCPYMCPLIVETGRGIDRALTPAQRARLGVAMVSMDPTRDTPEVLRRYAKIYSADPAAWHFLTGPPDEVRGRWVRTPGRGRARTARIPAQ